ncbi:MAG: transcription termination factor Rho [Anaerobutyricum sp.]|nr:transcription termination factor Rho [Eubacterium sp.]MDD7114839.1 transcription termination factor Rho [Lachnospiraceae bacterium]MDY6046457.1 transcription termination factor Rho [Anaerobutyricum sp.]
MDYNKMTIVQLRAAAKEKGLRGISTLKKEGLIERLLEVEQSKKETTLEKPPVEKEFHERRQEIERKNLQENQEQEEKKKQDDKPRQENGMKSELASLDSGAKADGILEVMPDGYGFIRCENYLPGENDVYVSPSQIRRFNLKTGDILVGNIRVKTQNEKYSALLYVESVNGYKPYDAQKRKNFEDLTPIFPNERIRLETQGAPVSMRMVDLLSPIGKGQRGMIVSQPKTGKTTLLKQIAKSITTSYPDMKLIVLLIDERPEEVTDIREYIEGPNAEVIYSTFDELPEHHKRVSEMVLERAKRLVEHKEDVVILLDSITRLARAYNLVVPPSGRTLSGGLDPAALHMPKKFFGAARNMREGGSLTILATALVDTGSKMDDVVFEEFKGTGNMELVLDRKLSEKRIFPAINIQKSGTRRDDLLLSKEEQEIVYSLHREMSGNRAEENVEQILQFFKKTRNNQEFISAMKQSLLK